MAGTELEGDEIRPTLNLSPEEIAILEQEKRELTGFAAAVRKSDGGRIRGEGTALDPEPKVVNIRQRLAQQRAAAGEPTEPLATDADRIVQLPNGKAITADPEVLTRLMLAAKKSQAEATEYRQLCDAAESDAAATRGALNEYLREHGLA